MVSTMAKRTDGGVRFRPVGSSRSRTAPVYSPRGTGCPAIEQAVQGLYQGQNEESFWTLMSALNYALELETHVLVPRVSISEKLRRWIWANKACRSAVE